jgi:hypothetical protein
MDYCQHCHHRYTPRISSPLNPALHPADVPKKREGRRKRILAGKKSSRGSSLTQKFLRRKAAEALKYQMSAKEAEPYVLVNDVYTGGDIADQEDQSTYGVPDSPDHTPTEKETSVVMIENVPVCEEARHLCTQVVEADYSPPCQHRFRKVEICEIRPISLPRRPPSRISALSVRRVAVAVGVICICWMLPTLRTHNIIKRQGPGMP